MAGHREGKAGPLFRPLRTNRTDELEQPLNANSLYRRNGWACQCFHDSPLRSAEIAAGRFPDTSGAVLSVLLSLAQ